MRPIRITLWLMTAFLIVAWSGIVSAEQTPEGQTLFLDNRCNTCHAVETAGIEAKLDDKGPDLSGLSKAVPSAEWAAQYVLREVDKDGHKHSRPYKGSKEDLETIIQWLMELEATHAAR